MPATLTRVPQTGPGAQAPTMTMPRRRMNNASLTGYTFRSVDGRWQVVKQGFEREAYHLTDVYSDGCACDLPACDCLGYGGSHNCKHRRAAGLLTGRFPRATAFEVIIHRPADCDTACNECGSRMDYWALYVTGGGLTPNSANHRNFLYCPTCGNQREVH